MATALLIDHDATRRPHFRSILLEAGLAVPEAAMGSAEGVLAHARDLRPNLIAIAADLPDVDVPALFRLLRDDPACAGTALVVVCGAARLADAAEREAATRQVADALTGGADDVVAAEEVPIVAWSRVRRLLHARRLAAMSILNEQLAQVGRLVAGIVHEIRAPLTVIRGNAELMAIELGPDHPAGIWFRPILRNAQTLQTRLEHLMAAVRVGPCNPRPLDVVPILRESINLFEKGTDARRERIAIDLSVDPSAGPIPPVLVDAGRLIQVVLNLLANAHDAIVAERPVGRIEVRVKPRPDEREVAIDVQDDGPGVGVGLLDRVFEPFFTTKAGGTGYGLFLAAEILREHGGRLAACNPDGGGACFSIHLPIAPAESL